MRILVLATGGTIDAEYSLRGEIEVGPPMATPILERARTVLDVTVESVCRKDSRDLDDADRDLIRRRVQAADAEHVVITHGTDSLTTTAEHLRGVTGKVVVLTGAIQPARMSDTDAAFNLGLAIAAVQTLPTGVYIAMSGRVLPAGAVVKDHTRGLFIERPAE
ncbi:asparaginase domain-containing protein [Pseudonocardia acaciae]|uniref:asparaginase domain-containing protein n=1 Tax=Pseudonocardia acaciae TaxID=551276 RepID=UPI00048EAF8F|nr:asparaginase domain-containing protein [Pseudonocardia acaciae]